VNLSYKKSLEDFSFSLVKWRLRDYIDAFSKFIMEIEAKKKAGY